jgi:hypothetical protein
MDRFHVRNCDFSPAIPCVMLHKAQDSNMTADHRSPEGDRKWPLLSAFFEW